ncbi:MAG: DUF2029 domain-containing protein [Flavobacteriales bacterium]|nr:MAG: DUF2029 domain-containing protein [Flavobacteriales bacterium]
MSLRPYRPFILLTSAFIVLMFALEHINGRFWLSDFKVYWGAADALLTGKAVYGVPFGESTGYYKYSPFVALLFTPLAALPFEVASIIWFVCISLALVAVLLQLHRILLELPIEPRLNDNALLCLALLCIGNHVVRELHLGNINLPLLLLATLALRWRTAKPWMAGAAMALLFMVKPYLGLVALPYLVHGRWHIVRAAVVAGCGMLLVPSMLGPGKAISLHREWLMSMSAHGDYLTSGNTIASIVSRIAGVPDSAGLQLSIIGVAVLGIVVLAWRWRSNSAYAQHYLLHFGALALIPNLVITDTQHFLLALPLFMFVLHRIRTLSWPVVVLLILVALAHGANSSDLLGHDLSDRVNAWGLLGLANVALVIVALMIEARDKQAD